MAMFVPHERENISTVLVLAKVKKVFIPAQIFAVGLSPLPSGEGIPGRYRSRY
jgi:hypothetical protein